MLRRISTKVVSLAPKKFAASLIAPTEQDGVDQVRDSSDVHKDDEDHDRKRKRRPSVNSGASTGRRLGIFPRIDKQQFLFCIPVFCLLMLLSQLNRWSLMVRAKNRRRRNNVLKQQLMKQHRQLHSDWAQEYVEAKQANMTFQLPTPWTVREYYNQQQKHPHTPQWLLRYVEFHKEHLFWKEDTQAWAIYDTTRYLKYSWCQTPTSFERRLWQSVSHLHSSECQTDLDVVHHMDGLLTALYVAIMTDRVLIIEDTTINTPLHPFLEENLINWNITEPPHDSEVSLLSTVQEEHLCQNLADTRGVVLVAQEWLGDRMDLWNSHCMKDFRNGELWEESVDNIGPVDLYQLGFWALFRVKESVLEDADAFRGGTGLTQGQQRHSLVDGQSHSTFEPYYYAGSTPDAAGNEGALRCAQKLYQTSLPLAAGIQEHANDDDDDDGAIDDDVKRLLNKKVLHRSLVLDVHVGQVGAKPPMIATVIPLQNTLEKTAKLAPKFWFPSSTTELIMHDELAPGDPSRQTPCLLWYRYFWTELVVSIEAECIIQPMHGLSNLGPTMLLVLAQRLSLSPTKMAQSWGEKYKTKTMKRCFARTDNCGSDIPSSEALLSMLVDTLPWTEDAPHTAGSID